MDLTRYLAVARRSWLPLVLSVVVGAAVAYTASRLVTPTYRATTTLLVIQQQTEGVVGLSDLQASERLANTFSELVTVRPVLEEAIARGGFQLTVDEMRGRLTVVSPPATQLLEITAEASTGEAARDLANTVASVFIRSNQSALANRPGIVSIVERAEAPTRPAAPNPLFNAIAAAVLSLMAASIVVVVAEYLDDTVKTDEQVAELTGLPVIGHVLRFPSTAHSQLQAGIEPSGQAAEAYRAIRTNVTYALAPQDGATRLLVTSARAGEGKSTTTANLAIVFGLAGSRVLLVDADLRRPSQHRVFGVTNGAGLSTILTRPEIELRSVVQRSAYERVWVLPSGPIPGTPSELLGSPRMAAFLDLVGGHFDVVLLDTPPVLAVTDPVVLLAQASTALVVAEHGKTRTGELKLAVQRLAMSGKPISGIVLNRAGATQMGYYAEYSSPRPSAKAPTDGGASTQRSASHPLDRTRSA